ncbi:MAG: aldose 1-epimerase [Francisella sp.]|jgi:aldose 1-epimerase
MLEISTRKVKTSKDFITIISLKNQNIELEVLDIGATVYSIKTKDRNGNLENIVLQYADINLYTNNPSFFGATIGRVAGRIKNGEFVLDNTKYNILTNEKSINTLHGGEKNISYQPFDYKLIAENKVELKHTQKNIGDGFPANVDICISYELLDNAVVIYFDAIADEDTILNLTNHNYYNLSGDYKATIENHILEVPASQFVNVDDNQISYEIINLPQQMIFDDCRIGEKLNANCEYLSNGGIDHCYIVDGKVILEDNYSGRKMKVTSSYPAVQIYTMNYPDGLALSSGKPSKKYDAICFEPQFVGAFDGNYTNHPMRLNKSDKYEHFIRLEF